MKQQKELDSVRKATLAAQKEREEQRAARERIIAERVLAAKNRQRARLGLPPLEKVDDDKPKEVDKQEEPVEDTEEVAKKLEAEAMKDQERKSHLRPWDEGKEGTSHLVPKEEVEWQYKRHKEPMSQEEWNEKKRTERTAEFAPTAALNRSPGKKKKKQKSQKDKGEREDSDHSFLSPPGVIDVPLPQQELDDDYEEERPGLYFTSKKTLKRRNYQPEDVPNSSRPTAGGAEIPPPPTFDYYGPSIIPKRPNVNPSPNLESSIEAGLKFLRNQTDKNAANPSSMWGANANYGRDV